VFEGVCWIAGSFKGIGIIFERMNVKIVLSREERPDSFSEHWILDVVALSSGESKVYSI